MARHRTFAREEKYPSYFVNAQEDFISTLAAGLTVTKLNATTVRVPAGTDNDRAVVAVAGLFRWRDANTDRAHPGGSAGTYAVFAVAKNNSVSNVPVSDTDATDYNFDLRIVLDGTTPAIVAGTVDVFRKIATLQWDGAQITSITQLVPASPRHAPTHAIGGSDPLTPADIGAATAAGLAQELTDRATGDSPYAAGRVVTWGGDTNLYRSAADTLKTDDSFIVGTNLSVLGAAAFTNGPTAPTATAGTNTTQLATTQFVMTAVASATNNGATTTASNIFTAMQTFERPLVTDTAWQVRTGPEANPRVRALAGGKLEWGPGGATAPDTNLYRSAVGTLKTDTAMQAASYAVGTTPLASTHLSDSAALARLAGPTFTGTTTISGPLAHTGTTVGFYGVTPAARPAARTLTNWTSGANALRTIDRNSFTTAQLYDFVMTLSDDLRILGLVA